MEFIDKVIKELGIPRKYTRIPNPNRSNRVLALVNKSWISTLLERGDVTDFHRLERGDVTDFNRLEHFTDDEVLASLHQGEKFPSHMQKLLIQVVNKPSENDVYIPLPRARHSSSLSKEAGLSYAQLLHYISDTNYKNLWKHYYKKCTGDRTKLRNREGLRHTVNSRGKDVLCHIISRLYGCKVISLHHSDNIHHESPSKVTEFESHPNILPVICVVESKSSFFLMFPISDVTTFKDCVTFSPALLATNYVWPLFVIYQLIQVMVDCHDRGLVLGDLHLDDIFMTDSLFIQVIPSLEDNLYKVPPEVQTRGASKPGCVQIPQGVSESHSRQSLHAMCSGWVQGHLSNFDYLLYLNKVAGRRLGDPTCHYIMPWVSDLSTKSSGVWRDLSKSKFRLNKGDQQLDLTFDNAGLAGQIPHHVTDVLSEITYYVYLARKTPRSILCKYVRGTWVPAEYPTSVQRLQHWTPDECIPEFFSEPSIFKSIHEDLPDLELPPWALTPEEFIESHRAALESKHVSERLHRWIDLTFGYKLSGAAAVQSKNVCLQLVDSHTRLMSSGVVQVFSFPHPSRQTHIPFFDKMPPKLNFRKIKSLSAMDRAREGVSEEEAAHSSANEEEDSLDTKTSPLVLSRFMSRSRGSLLASFQSSAAEETSRADPSRPSVPLPKEFNPAALLTTVESGHSFFRKTFALDPDGVCESDNTRATLKQVVAGKRLQEMEVLGCLIVEMFLNARLRVMDTTTLARRVAACTALLSHESLPRCVRSAARLLLQAQQAAPVTSSGLPPPSAHQLLQPLLSSFIFPFAKLYPAIYTAVCNLNTCSRAVYRHSLLHSAPCSDCKALNSLKVRKFCTELDKLWDEMLSCNNQPMVDLVFPLVKELLDEPNTSPPVVFLLLDKVACCLGPQRTTALLLETMVCRYENSDNIHGNAVDSCILPIYHRHHLLVLIIRFGLKVFLDNFVAPLVETVGRCSDRCRNDPRQDMDAFDVDIELSPLDDDFSEEAQKTAAACETEALREVAVFRFDKEENQQEEECDRAEVVTTEDALDTGDVDVEGGDRNCGQQESDRDGSALKSPDIAIPGAGGRTHHKLPTIECEVGSRSNSSHGEFVWPGPPGFSLTEPGSIYKESSSLHLKACEVAADSILWLSHRLGPVLTCRHITRNLLRMLSYCYIGPDNLKPCVWVDEGLSRLSVCRWRVCGDENAESVAQVLCGVAEIYSEQMIVLQYLPYMSDLIGLSKRKFTPSLEGGVIGCLALLQHVVPLLNDTTLMDQLQDLILKSIVHPVVRLVSSTRLVFPSGHDGRYALVTKLVDALHIVAVRIGAEMTRTHLAVPSLQRFFLAFDKAHGIPPTPADRCTRTDSPSSRSGDEGRFLEIQRDGSTTEWQMRAPPGLPLSFSHVRSHDSADWSSSPPQSGTEDSGRASGKAGLAAESELKRVFNAELAHRCYLTFARFLGESTMENTVKNQDLIRDLCVQYEAVQSIHSQPGDTWSPEFLADHLSAQDYGTETGGSGSFGSNVAVIGNKIELQSMEPPTAAPHSSGREEDLTALVSRKMQDTTRHLRGNWLAYWEHEIGRSDKDHRLNLKQMKLMTYTGHSNSVRMVTCLDNENSFMTGSKDKTVKLWSLRSQGDGSATSSCQFSYGHHRKSLLSLTFVSSLRVVASCDSTVHLWDPFQGRTISVLDTARTSPINVLREIPAPSTNLVAGTTDATLRIIDARLCAHVCEYKVSWTPVGLIRSLCVSPSGAWVAVGQASGLLTVLDLRTGMVLASWRGHEGEVLQLAAVSESLLLSSSLDQTISVWSVSDGKFKFHMKGPAEPVHCLSVSNNELITCTTANRIGVHTSLDSQASFSSTKLRSDTLRGVVTAMTMLPLNKLALLGGDNGMVTLLC